MSPAHKPSLYKVEEPEEAISVKIVSTRMQTQEFLQHETEYTARTHVSMGQKESEKVGTTS